MKKIHLLNTLKAVLAAGVLGLVACGGGGGGDSGGSSGSPAPAFTMSLFAGSLQSAGSRDGSVVTAQFNRPAGAAQDAAGNVYIADTGNHTIRKITPQGAVTTLAGVAGQVGSADGPGATARFSSPQGLATDAAGSLYVADTGNHTVRKISTAGVVTTLAGVAGEAGITDGAKAVARLTSPTKLAVDAAGRVYVLSDTAVRTVAPDGSVSTFPVQRIESPSSLLRFSGIAIDAAGNVLVADTPANFPFLGPSAIRKFSPQGQALPLGRAENGILSFNYPVDIAVDANGSVYAAQLGYHDVSGTNFRNIQRIAPDGSVVLVAGQASERRLDTVTIDGAGSAARFVDPRIVSVGPGGRLIVVETATGAIRAVDAQGNVSTLAGGNGTGYKDGEGSAARFQGLAGLAAAGDGGLYAVDSGNRALRKISSAGAVSTVSALFTLADSTNVAVGPDGTVYVTSFSYNRFCIGPYYSVLRFVGGAPASPALGYNGSESARALAVDAGGNIVVAEQASTESACGPAYGKPTQLSILTLGGNKRVLATGIEATALAADATGQVYFASQGTVGSVLPSGEVQIRAGVNGQIGDADGTGSAARFRAPTALALDPANNLYVADGTRVRRVTPGGVVTTVADLAQLEGVIGMAPIGGLAWVSGALYASAGNAVIRIAPATP